MLVLLSSYSGSPRGRLGGRSKSYGLPRQSFATKKLTFSSSGTCSTNEKASLRAFGLPGGARAHDAPCFVDLTIDRNASRAPVTVASGPVSLKYQLASGPGATAPSRR